MGLKKAELLQLKLKEIRLSHERFKNIFPETYFCNKNTNQFDPTAKIINLDEQVSYLVFSIHNEDKNLKDLVNESHCFTKAAVEAEKLIKHYLTQLKHTTDSLFKALAAYEKRLSQLFTNHETVSDHTDLTSDEVTDLASNVLSM